MLNYKNIFESIELLYELRNINHQLIVIDKPDAPYNKATAYFNKNVNKGYSIFSDNFNYRLEIEEIDKIKLITYKHEIFIERIFINSISFPYGFNGLIDNFSSLNFSKKDKYFYRLYLPLEKVKAEFHYFIQEQSFNTKKYISRGLIKIKYKNNKEIDVYHHENKEKGESFLIIDSNSSKYTFNEFSELAFSSLVGLGFVTGKLHQNEGYFFAYNKSDLKTPIHFYYTEFRDSIYSSYTPIYANAHGYIRDHKVAEKIYPTLKVLSTEQFALLCNKIHESIELSAILLLIIEASKSSLLVMPSGFSIALEGLTELIVQENIETFKPIKDKKLSKRIIKELKSIIETHKSDIDDLGFQILNKIIENINKPTNRDKLSKPFKILKINLNKNDFESIDKRNDFLHGRITLNSDSKENINISNKEIFYTSLKLYTLLSALILKWIGFNNKIVNYPKIHEKFCNKILNEEYFRQI